MIHSKTQAVLSTFACTVHANVNCEKANIISVVMEMVLALWMLEGIFGYPSGFIYHTLYTIGQFVAISLSYWGGLLFTDNFFKSEFSYPTSHFEINFIAFSSAFQWNPGS